MASSTIEELVAARTKIEARLGEARAKLHDARILAARKACCAADVTQEYVKENPLKVIGVVVAAGLLTAFLLSRR